MAPRKLPPGNKHYRFWIVALTAILLPALVVTGGTPALQEGDEEPELFSVAEVEFQPLAAATERLLDALEFVGAPITGEDREALEAALENPDPQEAIEQIQEVLDPLCLLGVEINPESRVHVVRGPAEPELIQNGWRAFLVKVHNDAGINAQLNCTSPQAVPQRSGRNQPVPPEDTPSSTEVLNRFLDIEMFGRPPLTPELSRLELEYRVLLLYSSQSGRREANLVFDIGQGQGDLGFRSEIPVLFECAPSVEVVLGVTDHDGEPTTGSFTIRDAIGRVYPNPARRIAPDFFFHAQVYRADGESVLLPPGNYHVTYTRGPEYLVLEREITVPEGVRSHREEFRLQRWIHAAAEGYWSGDHHVHAAGCAHYDTPSEGVMPADMMRHILGEDLNVGCVLSWGPCWYFQKQFFEGRVHELSRPNYLMRYDVEVSGFPSSHAGHLCLLRLTEDDYRGTSYIEEWPSWDLPVLQWGQEQDAVVGFSHSGWGLQVPGDELPNYSMPPFDGIGANEYIVDVTHDAVDFISMVDTPAVWELNIWYHTLNCGYRCRVSGETDFPCIYGERVGLGRVYVHLPTEQLTDYDAWVEGVRDGRSYVSDGRSHLMGFAVNDVRVGEPGSGDEISQLDLDEPGNVRVTARVAAYLNEEPNPDIQNRPLDQKPYWDVERARIGETRRVPVELIVNGYPVARQEIEADGSINEVEFDVPIERSSWVALRIFPSSHTNPVFVHVAGAPIRASRRSAEWCLNAVDVCWQAKSPRIRPEELEAAEAAYQHARECYQRILEECEVE